MSKVVRTSHRSACGQREVPRNPHPLSELSPVKSKNPLGLSPLHLLCGDGRTACRPMPAEKGLAGYSKRTENGPRVGQVRSLMMLARTGKESHARFVPNPGRALVLFLAERRAGRPAGASAARPPTQRQRGRRRRRLASSARTARCIVKRDSGSDRSSSRMVWMRSRRYLRVLRWTFRAAAAAALLQDRSR